MGVAKSVLDTLAKADGRECAKICDGALVSKSIRCSDREAAEGSAKRSQRRSSK